MLAKPMAIMFLTVLKIDVVISNQGTQSTRHAATRRRNNVDRSVALSVTRRGKALTLNATAMMATYWIRTESHAQVGCSLITKANTPVDNHSVLNAHLAHVLTLISVDNPCKVGNSNGGCSQKCNYNRSTKKVTCSCYDPSSYSLDTDGRTCCKCLIGFPVIYTGILTSCEKFPGDKF